ncbi:MAG: hypothetical protein IJI96_03335 [Methanobrevibacter sp.]|nr:hypothetical protein [Methanobrevibacter sp.]
MTLLCKQKALYVKCCIIQNGVPDFHDDVLNSEDIKKIFTTFNNQSSFEIYHNEIPITEVSLLENYISTSDEVIAETTVPAGSWNAVIRVDNPTIKEHLLNNDFGGVSLNNRVQTSCSTGLAGDITYADLRDAECVIPVYISFVEAPANNVGLHIMDYNVYIRKSKQIGGKENMSLLEDLKALVSKAEAQVETTEAEPVEVEKSETVEDAEVVEIEKEAPAEEEEEKQEEAEAETEENKEEEEAEEIEKAETEEEATAEEETVVELGVEDEIALLKEEIANIKAQLEALIEVNPIDEEVTSADVNSDEPIITKSAKIEVVEKQSANVKNFYEMTNRDPLTGKKIRKETRILN